jgi:hypothetical protein
MTPHQLARKMVTIHRADRAGYGDWEFSIARRATQPRATPWLEIRFATRAEAEVEARCYRRAIVDGIREAAVMGVAKPARRRRA